MGGICDSVHKIIMELKNSHVLNDNIAITVQGGLCKQTANFPSHKVERIQL